MEFSKAVCPSCGVAMDLNAGEMGFRVRQPAAAISETAAPVAS